MRTPSPAITIGAIARRPGYGTYYTDPVTNEVRVILDDGSIPPVSVTLSDPQGIAYYDDGTKKMLYVADRTGGPTGSIWQSDVTGLIPTSFTKLATNLNEPTGLAISATGRLFVAVTGDGVVKEVNRTTGATKTVVSGSIGSSPDTVPMGYDLATPVGLGERVFE